MARQRWPLEPLLEVTGTTSTSALAVMVGAHRRQAQRWFATGDLTDVWADRAAVALGSHPVLIWPDWFGA